MLGRIPIGWSSARGMGSLPARPEPRVWRVTLTGADDAVDPAALLELSWAFPIVEWGILFAGSRAGSPRYPTSAWRERLCRMAADATNPPKLSAHLCGPLAKDPRPALTPLERVHFERIQLNGFTVEQAPTLDFGHRVEVILQARSEDTLQGVASFATARPTERLSVLFDPSGGRGVQAFKWPMPPLGVRIGYAGGIGPDNVLDVLGEIALATGGLTDELPWVDMESGVRDEANRFDLGKVRRVLEQVAAVNAQATKGGA